LTFLGACVGFSDQQTLKLDFDGVKFRTVKYWSLKACRKFRLEGFIILKSSKNHYHVVFNRPMKDWSENVKHVAWMCLWTKYRTLTEWLIMQLIKGSSTLRVGPKGNKPKPRIVYRHGKQDKQIKQYLEHRKKIIKNVIKKLQKQNQKEYAEPQIGVTEIEKAVQMPS